MLPQPVDWRKNGRPAVATEIILANRTFVMNGQQYDRGTPVTAEEWNQLTFRRRHVLLDTRFVRRADPGELVSVRPIEPPPKRKRGRPRKAV